jgi:hypothetical protein
VAVRRARWWVVAGLAAVVLIAAGVILALSLSSGPAAPAQATAAVSTFLNGNRDEVVASLSPPLAVQLAPDVSSGPRPRAQVELTGWSAQGVFAGATAMVRLPDGDIKMDVGFRLVGGRWRLTFAQARPQ